MSDDSVSVPRNERAAGSAIGGRLRRVLRHVRNPQSLPPLLLKNIKYALAPQRLGRPEDPRVWSDLGRRLDEQWRHEEALACYDRALAIRRDIPQVLSNRGRALRNLGRLDEAEANLREALRLKPDLADAHHNLGRVLFDLGRWEEAVTSIRTALRIQPEFHQAWHGLGNIFRNLGRSAEAQESYRTGLHLRPESPELHAGLGMALLLAGQFEEGLKEFEWRRQTIQLRRFSAAAWNGEAIGDRALLLHATNGFGDTLQFCRYVPQIASAARTVLEVQPSLARLLSRLPGPIEIIAGGDPLPAFDLQCPLMSLPYALGTTLETIPAATPYLTAEPAEVAHWRERLAGLAGLRVGLCWAGGRSNNREPIAWNRRRSISLDTLGPFGEISGVQFISLQKGPPAAEAARSPHGMALHDFTDDLHDFADTAALIGGLDLVISVDTAVAHLAGALGKPVWLLNCYGACWRWLQNRDDSPWYPSLRQFRQPTPGDWHSVISRVQGALRRLAAGDRGQLWPPTMAS
jgi:tetratricopeptide (TPR) repeat protein